MKDEQITKLVTYLRKDRLDEVDGRRSFGMETAIAKPFGMRCKKREARRIDVWLETLTAHELNDLRTMLAIGKHKGYNSPGKYEPKKINDLKAWRSYLGIERKSQEASVIELKKLSAWAILEDLNTFIKATR